VGQVVTLQPDLGVEKPQSFGGAVLMPSPGPVVMLPGMFAAVFNLNGHPHYVHSGWFLISVGNLIVIVAMSVVFVLALALPFPRGDESE
jgi:uncharacterized membrane protein